MSKIIEYSNEVLRPFLVTVENSFEQSKNLKIPYDIWNTRMRTRIFNNPDVCNFSKYSDATHIRYTSAETVLAQLRSVDSELTRLNDLARNDLKNAAVHNKKLQELLIEVLVPECEFDYPGFVNDENGVPMWFGTTVNQLNLVIGPKDLDLSVPSSIKLAGDQVHLNLTGVTGSGKSKFMLQFIANLLYLFPPWELTLTLIDNKIAEFHYFGRYVQTPHADIIAATDSKEFILDLYKDIQQENVRRQIIFNKVGVDGLPAFRKQFNLTIPRRLFIVDELVAMLKKIRMTSSEGNDNANAECNAIFTALQQIATLGRNACVHQFISSQDLGTEVSPEISSQWSAGIILKSNSNLSESCIGNDVSSKIDRHGICYTNAHRQMADNEKYNTLVGVPLIDEERNPESGLTPIQEDIVKMQSLCQEFGFHKPFMFYDADALIPHAEYEEFVKTSKSLIENNININQCCIPLGKQISYTNATIISCDLLYRPGDNIIIDSKEDERAIYAFNLFSKTFKLELPNSKIRIYSTSNRLFDKLQLDSSHGELQVTETFPVRELNLCNSRRDYLTVSRFLKEDRSPQGLLQALKDAGLFNGEIDKPFVPKCLETTLSGSIDQVMSILQEYIPDTQNPEYSIYGRAFYTIMRLNHFLEMSKSLTGLDNIRPCSFEPVLNIFLGFENINELTDRDYLRQLRDYFTNSPRYNIVNVVYSETWANSNWSELFSPEVARYVLEYSDIQFFRALGLGDYTANVNTRSLVVHDRQRKDNKFIKFFGGI